MIITELARRERTIVVLHCPIPIDRSTWRRKVGWSGDPASRFTTCGWSMAYEDGDYEEFPNGPRHDRAAETKPLLDAHIRTHELEDFIELARRAER